MPITAGALVPWICDALLSNHSVKAYGRDLMDFLRQMQSQGVTPLEVTADHVKCYKRALLEAGLKSATVARRLSVLRGTYKQLATKGLVSWETAQDIAAVKAPGVQKNSTLSLTERQAISLLEAIPTETLQGIRDLALMSVLLVDERLPRVELSELLVEVDGWTGFSGCLEHAGGREPRSRDLTRHLYAAILAQGCNLGLTPHGPDLRPHLRPPGLVHHLVPPRGDAAGRRGEAGQLPASPAPEPVLGRRHPLVVRWPAVPGRGQGPQCCGPAALLRLRQGGDLLHLDLGPVRSLRRRQEEEQVHQATCLNLLTNSRDHLEHALHGARCSTSSAGKAMRCRTRTWPACRRAGTSTSIPTASTPSRSARACAGPSSAHFDQVAPQP